MSAFWPALRFFCPLALVAASLPLVEAIGCGVRAIPCDHRRSIRDCWKRRGLVIAFYLMQPAARLIGRMFSGLNPWRFRRAGGRALPRRRTWSLWSERWQDMTSRLERLEAMLRMHNAVTVRGGSFDAWDLKVLGGVLASAQLRMVIEEHGDGKQMIRLRAWPACSRMVTLIAAALILIGLIWAHFGAVSQGAIFVVIGTGLVALAIEEASAVMGTVTKVISGGEDDAAAR